MLDAAGRWSDRRAYRTDLRLHLDRQDGGGKQSRHEEAWVRSPDLADAFLLTFACGERRKERYRKPEPRNYSAWAV